MDRAIHDAIACSKIAGANPEFHLGVYHVLERDILNLPQILLDRLHDEKE